MGSTTSSPVGFWWAFVTYKESHAIQQPTDKSGFSWGEEKVQITLGKKMRTTVYTDLSQFSSLFIGHSMILSNSKGAEKGTWDDLGCGTRGAGERRKEGDHVISVIRTLPCRSLLELPFISEREIQKSLSKRRWKNPNSGESDLCGKEPQWWLLILGAELSEGKLRSLRANTEVVDAAKLAGIHG